jgi:ubiquinone/menaquinone biosynthesis C-methylase UbiE
MLDNKFIEYATIQKRGFEADGNLWTLENKDAVVGLFEQHNNSDLYKYLFETLNQQNTKEMVALDFGCGPGRNIVLYKDLFKRIDGTDIAKSCLEKARIWLQYNNIDTSDINLYEGNGYNLENIPNNFYNVVFGTIVLQHIGVYSIRHEYFKEFFRVLKPNGTIHFQTTYNPSFNENDHIANTYYDDSCRMRDNNRGFDVVTSNIDFIKKDLEDIGFSTFNYKIVYAGPGCYTPYWVFFSAVKV